MPVTKERAKTAGFMDLKAAAAYIGVNQEVLRRKIAAGEFKADGRFGTHYRFKKESIDRQLKEAAA
jgi:excisionase family DNA binding protein